MDQPPQNIYALWQTLAHDLADVFDLHGVCATIAAQTAAYVGRQTIVAMRGQNGRYYDVWIAAADDGRVKQDRWRNDDRYLDQLAKIDQPRHISKHTQSAKILLNHNLWFIPESQLTVAPLPTPVTHRHIVPLGIIAIADLPTETTDPILPLTQLTTTATLLTTYLERAMLRYERDRQAIEFAIISEISQTLSGTLDLTEVFADVTESIRRILHVETISLALIDKDTGRIRFVPDLMGEDVAIYPPLELEPGQGIAGWVGQHNQALIVNDVYADKRFFRQPDKDTGFQTRSILCIPLHENKRVIGVLEAINKRNGEFTEHDLKLLEAFGGPLAASILNSELHGRAVAEKRRIETILQSMSEGLITLDAHHHITVANEAFLSILGRPAAEIVGRAVKDIIHLKDHDFVEFIERVEAETTEAVGDFPQLVCEIRRDHTYTPVLASGTVVRRPDGNSPTEIVIVFSDLRQIREVERMRDDFFHNIVHELRTPLALILMYARLLIKGAKDDPDKSERFLKTIERESDRLQTMVRQMLELAKLESSDIQRKAHEIDLNALLDDLLPPLADKATEKGLTFIQRIASDLPPIIGDEQTIYTIFKNLVENAIKFTIQGKVEVEAQIDGDGRIRVRVADDGIGIPAEALPNLFRRFYRTQTAVERGIAGTGLGLYMVKEGVEKHRGTLDVTSQIDDGTTFTITLPSI